MLPLTTADLLAHAIVGSVLENLDMERLVREVGHAVAQRILGNNESVDDVARELHEKLLLRNESTKKVVIESIYKESDEAKHNVEVFTRSPGLQEARTLLKRVKFMFCPIISVVLILGSLFRSMERVSRKSTFKRVNPFHEAHMALMVLHRALFRKHQHRLSLLHRPHHHEKL